MPIIGPINPSRGPSNPALARKILLSISAVLLIASAAALFESISFRKKAVVTTGTVVELRKERGFRAIFQYTDSTGQTYTKASSWKANPPMYQIGDTAPLAYNPSTPSRARISDRWHAYPLVIVLSLLAVIFIINALCLPRSKSRGSRFTQDYKMAKKL